MLASGAEKSTNRSSACADGTIVLDP